MLILVSVVINLSVPGVLLKRLMPPLIIMAESGASSLLFLAQQLMCLRKTPMNTRVKKLLC